MAKWVFLNWYRGNIWLMLIAGFLREDFIKKSFELSKTELEDLLMLFKDCDYLIVIKDPNFSLSKIFESLPKNISRPIPITLSVAATE